MAMGDIVESLVTRRDSRLCLVMTVAWRGRLPGCKRPTLIDAAKSMALG